MLQASGDLIGDIRPITHPVKFYEKGDRPLEIVTSRQWFIKTIEYRDGLLARGRELIWYPPFMQSRYQELGRGADWRLVRQPAAFLRRAVSGVVSAFPQTARFSTSRRCYPMSPSFRSIRRRMCRRDTSPANAICPAASPAIPTSWTRGRPHRSRRKSPAGGWTIRTCSRACSRWICGRRRTRSSGRGCSTPSRARTTSTIRCRGRRRRFPDG